MIKKDSSKETDALKEMETAEKDIKIGEKRKDIREDLELEKDIIKKLKKRKVSVQIQKEEKVSPYVRLANKLFAKISLSLYKNNAFGSLKEVCSQTKH